MTATKLNEAPRLPWVGEFTPGQLGPGALKATLEIVAQSAGDRNSIISAIREGWFTESAKARESPEEQLEQQRVRAGNVLNGMQSFGLVDGDYVLTALGGNLHGLHDENERASQFVVHLLKHCQGLELLAVAHDLESLGITVTKKAVDSALQQRGYKLTTNSGDSGKLRRWLSTAGVVGERDWAINEVRLAELTGTTLEVAQEFQGLTRAQRGFLATIRRIGEVRGETPIASPELLDAYRDEHGPLDDPGQVRRKIYAPLAEGGWVVHEVEGKGRGGKGGSITPTLKLLDVDFELLTGFRPGSLPADLRAVLATPRDKIYQDLQSDDKHIKGLALELLAVNIASDLGLIPLRLRVRGVATGGAEVDLVAEAAHLQFTRWIFQCKNTGKVGVEVLAKEIGMAALLQAQVIVIATTGTVAKTVRAYADQIAKTTPYQVVLLDGASLGRYKRGGAPTLREQFRSDAAAVMAVKRPQVIDMLDEMGDDQA